jgi:hypothetical protein
LEDKRIYKSINNRINVFIFVPSHFSYAKPVATCYSSTKDIVAYLCFWDRQKKTTFLSGQHIVVFNIDKQEKKIDSYVFVSRIADLAYICNFTRHDDLIKYYRYRRSRCYSFLEL